MPPIDENDVDAQLTAQVDETEATPPAQRERQGVITVELIRHMLRAIVNLRGRLTTVEGTNVVTLELVAAIGDLPANAGPRQFFRVQGDPALYVGNGMTQPLRKVPTSPL